MKLVNIQILRFLAAISVVLFHALGTGQNYFGPRIGGWIAVFSYGGFGVDLFFVISGFIIYYSTSQREQSAGQFLRSRLQRIVPVYWLFTFAFLATSLLIPAQIKSDDLLNPGLIASSLFYVSFLLGRMPVLFVGWSLEYEMLFYIAVSALLYFGRRPSWNLLIACFCCLVLIGLASGPGTEGTADGAAFDFFTSPLLLEFVLGIAAARYALQNALPWRPTLMTLATLALVALFAAAGMRNRVAIVGSGAVLLVILAARTGRFRAEPGRIRAALAMLGDAAYSIYLVQIFTISGACKLMKSLIPGMPLEAVVLGSTLVTLVVGYGSFILIERPLLALCRRAKWPTIRAVAT